MDEAYLALNRHIFTPILERFHVPPEDRAYMMSFYISGLIAVINEWLKNDCKDPHLGHADLHKILIPKSPDGNCRPETSVYSKP